MDADPGRCLVGRVRAVRPGYARRWRAWPDLGDRHLFDHVRRSAGRALAPAEKASGGVTSASVADAQACDRPSKTRRDRTPMSLDTLERTRTDAGDDGLGAPLPGMVFVPGGTFRMGSDRHYPEEAPVHRVTVDGFW